IREKNADMLIAGGRNQYLAVKEGIPFVDVNQERHVPYAGYGGLANLAREIAGSMKFYGARGCAAPPSLTAGRTKKAVINPIKHSQSVGAAIAMQGVDRALPVLHGAQGCSFLAKVLLTRHFREPIALASTKLFTEDVVMGSEEVMTGAVRRFISAQNPRVLAVLSSGLAEIKGDDIGTSLSKVISDGTGVIYVSTPDFEGGLETGYARCVEALVRFGAERFYARSRPSHTDRGEGKAVNVLADWHHTPADFNEIREMIESFGLHPVMVPDLSALDGSRQGMSPLAAGGVTSEELSGLGTAGFTLAIGLPMEGPARLLKDLRGVGYRTFAGLSSLEDVDSFMDTLSELSGGPVPRKYERQRSILIDGMRDAHSYFIGRRVCLALEPGHAVSVSKWLDEMAAQVELVVVPQMPHFDGFGKHIRAKNAAAGDLLLAEDVSGIDLLVGSSHARQTSERLGAPLFETGFPVFGKIGHASKLTIGYAGALASINEAANLLGTGPIGTGPRKEVYS
ncbi:MAG: nitrogenase iron-molybdenum cofactor biosynthesis protein NifN, partial [Nitrospiraceae bacterium]|nr:nitrogenase iron-molybdenum cofactor biosynthesis protein NifN [Nitrospiraceae bacterium]